MARQHGYIAMIPVFIPVDAKSLKNQIAAGTALHEAAQTRDLSTITSLPGIRLHIAKGRDGVEKDIITRWTSVDAPEPAPEGRGSAQGLTDADRDEPAEIGGEGRTVFDDLAEQTAPVEQDEATTAGRRRRAAA